MWYQKNLEYITKKFPHLLKGLSVENPDETGLQVEVVTSKKNLPVARLMKEERRVYLNSSYDPVLEAERWLANLQDDQHQVIVMVGAGFLYHLQAVLASQRFQKVVCYEPSYQVLKACLHHIDLAGIIDQQEVLLVAGSDIDDLVPIIGRYLLHQITNIREEVLPSYREVFQREISEFRDKLRGEVRVTRVNLATSLACEEQWMVNALKNMAYLADSPGIRHFFNKFSQVPAIIVSAGPSLEKNIHLIRDLRERAVIICAGSSIRAMRRNKVLPHFLVAFDGTDNNANVYNDLDLRNIYLVYNMRLYHDVVAKYGGPKIHIKLDSEQFTDMITYKNGGYDYGMIRSGFSVAHSCLDLAFKLGCNPIAFIGQDLSYNNNKRYAEGRTDSRQKYLEPNKLPPNAFLAKDIYGQDVVTEVEFESFRIWFEKIIRDFYQDKATIINATEGGLPIQGAENRELSAVIADYCQKDQGIAKKIAAIYEKGLNELKKYKRKTLNIPREIEILVMEGIQKLEGLIARLEELRKTNFIQPFALEKLEPVLNQIIQEFHVTLRYREYVVLLKDIRDAQITALNVMIADLGTIADKEKYDQKLQYWLNIFWETKKHLERIRECNQELLS